MLWCEDLRAALKVEWRCDFSQPGIESAFDLTFSYLFSQFRRLDGWGKCRSRSLMRTWSLLKDKRELLELRCFLYEPFLLYPDGSRVKQCVAKKQE